MPAILLKKLPDITGPKFTAQNTTVRCDPPSTTVPTSKGTLYIDTHQLVFFSSQSNKGFAIDYPSIVIHAISREPAEETKDSHHIYCQLDCQFPGTQQNSDTEQDGTEDLFAELRFYPDDKDILDDVFAAMSECAALNPDDLVEVYSDDEDLDGHSDREVNRLDDPSIQSIGEFDPSNFITSVDQLEQLTPEGKAVLKHLESVIVLPEGQENGRFSDAEKTQD
ncbi:hypothetical protein LPJ64_004657 [Coemansia asiatica]|uniref:Regulator of volume decrease after cellular swelling-domain-containing protein n=1 Tax=Coemansia asiatica TaxID=1052880 RepID=A0A9W7XHV8_9FUNG|nr:hypothetical protein LPJ64_004657 [Coemansia asiatica]KAJ2859872.1 hypothetical protein FB639_005712 [Coemansia asiatica]